MSRALASWSIWRLPRVAVLLLLSVELAALLVPVLSWCLKFRMEEADLSAALASLSIAYSIFTRRAERARSTLHKDADTVTYQNLLGTWGFAASVLLPLPMMWLVAVGAAVAEWPVRNIAGRARPYRHVYSSAVAILAGVSAHAIVSLVTPNWLGIALAVPVYMAVGISGVVAAMLAVGQPAATRDLLRPHTHRVELCSIGIAVGLIFVIAHGLPMLAWLSLPAAIALQRLTTRNRLHQVSEDATVEPMSEEAWSIAAREVVAALPVVSVLRIDTNTPAAVNAIAQLQLGCDALGYVGKNSLGMLLVDCPALSAESMASRLRTALIERGMPAGVAAAGKPRDGASLADLLAVCEAELIAREAIGRAFEHPRSEA